LLTELLRELSAQDIEISPDLGCALKLRLEVSLNLFDLLRDRGEHPERGSFAGRASWFPEVLAVQPCLACRALRVARVGHEAPLERA
jgi:hypothetical protein